MITYKPIIIQGGRRKDGTWPVKIRVTFKGVARRLPTTLTCTDQDLTRSGRIKNASILEKAGELITRMRATTESISPFALEAWDVDRVVEHIRTSLATESFRLDYFAFGREFIQGKDQGTRALTVDEIQRFIDWEPEQEVDRVARAAFLLSFATMGANLADLYEAKAMDGEDWKYNRKKTRKRRADGAEVRVLLSEVLTPLLRDLGGQSGGVWWLPALHRWKGDNIATNEINKALRRWIAQEGLEDFTFGGARHSWGTIARNVAKVEKATVDEALAHVGDFRVTDMYVERSWDLAWEANEKVLALFRWPRLQDPEN